VENGSRFLMPGQENAKKDGFFAKTSCNAAEFMVL